VKNTVTFMLDELSTREITDLIALTGEFHKRFGAVAHHLLAVAREKGIEERVARLSIATETLLLSAMSYPGTPDSFIEAARKALDDAGKIERQKQPKAGTP
jgi:hypothetical protein